MAKQEMCALCGEWFVKEGMNHNQKYCCKDCSYIAHRKSVLESSKRRKANSKATTQGTQSPSIPDMVDIMMRLSTLRGRPVQYGEVQTELLTGKLKIKGGAIV